MSQRSVLNNKEYPTPTDTNHHPDGAVMHICNDVLTRLYPGQ